jgi:hypothetical protein
MTGDLVSRGFHHGLNLFHVVHVEGTDAIAALSGFVE